jgi:4-deoxy-L-threo-5-hexosulose-uronate ketol-isomerase
MEVRYLPNEQSYQRLNTSELRQAFVCERLFVPGEVNLVYCDTDRAIVGGIIPRGKPLPLVASRKEMAAEFFAERREIGVINLGAPGTIRADGKEYPLGTKDMMYIGRGVKSIDFASQKQDSPAVFYMVSYPAHVAFPTALVHRNDANRTELGTVEAANKRTINKYIHAGGPKSCQLVMGLTELSTGSVWNTMPPHTHQRRMEIYLYFDLHPDSIVVHLMGKPDETRSLILRNQQVVISPSWSIHSGTGTGRYAFVWAMGGENQDFADMDPVPMAELK